MDRFSPFFPDLDRFLFEWPSLLMVFGQSSSLSLSFCFCFLYSLEFVFCHLSTMLCYPSLTLLMRSLHSISKLLLFTNMDAKCAPHLSFSIAVSSVVLFIFLRNSFSNFLLYE